MRVLLVYLRRHWRVLLATLALALVSQALSLLDPLVFRYAIDYYAAS